MNDNQALVQRCLANGLARKQEAAKSLVARCKRQGLIQPPPATSPEATLAEKLAAYRAECRERAAQNINQTTGQPRKFMRWDHLKGLSKSEYTRRYQAERRAIMRKVGLPVGRIPINISSAKA